MHGVPHLRGIHASIIVWVVVMGRCARGTFGSREGDGVALGVAGMASARALVRRAASTAAGMAMG